MQILNIFTNVLFLVIALPAIKIFNVLQLHTILDEVIFGGQVLETSSTEVMKAVEEISRFLSLSLSLSLLSVSVLV